MKLNYCGEPDISSPSMKCPECAGTGLDFDSLKYFDKCPFCRGSGIKNPTIRPVTVREAMALRRR